MKRKSESGFTLVEVIVSAVIISLLAAVIYSTFAQGIKLWHYAWRERPEWQIDIFFDKFGSHLRNAMDCKVPPMQGRDDRIEFCVAGKPQMSKEKIEFRPVAGVKYSYDAGKKTVFAVYRNYQQIMNPKNRDMEPVPVVSGINEFRIEYFEKDELKNDWNWRTKWEKPCFPVAVKVSIDYGTARKKTMTRYFPMMPTGSCVNAQTS